MILIIISIIVIAIAVVVSVQCFSSPQKSSVSSIFDCANIIETEQYATTNGVAYELHDNTLHLFNIEFLGHTGYCVAEFQFNTNELKQMTFCTTVENSDQMMDVIEDVKASFLVTYGFDAEYEYFPLDDGMDTVGEKEFLAQKASKELFVDTEVATWNISWLVTDEGVSAKISKTVLN